jgi:NADH-quinone oxidoreductase subunit N
MNLATFSIILLLTSGKKMPKYLVAWTSISQCNALLTITLALTLFSTAGIPPLAGFWSKLGILFSTISEGYAAMALLVVLFSSVACFYYIRLIKIFFFTPISCFWFNTSSAITSTLLGSSVSVIIFFLAWPNSLLNFSTIAALTLL